MKLKPAPLGISVLWLFISLFGILNTRSRIIFERNHLGQAMPMSYVFLALWIGVLWLGIWSCWASHKRRNSEAQVD